MIQRGGYFEELTGPELARWANGVVLEAAREGRPVVICSLDVGRPWAAAIMAAALALRAADIDVKVYTGNWERLV